jgi:ZipA, C-terminal FtsZ-binding domain
MEGDQNTVQTPTEEDPLPNTNYISKIDPNIDCVVSLRFNLLIKGQELIEKIMQWPKNPTYRLAFEGLHEKDDTQSWEILVEDHDYRELQLSIQLANRRGPITKDDLAEFLGLAAQLASDTDAEMDLPPIQQVLSQAEDLDQFAVQCDVQLGLNLVPNMISWAVKDVESILLKYGFTLSRDGLFFNYSNHQQLVFKAQIPQLNLLTDDLQTARVKNIVFAFDVPLVPQELAAFSQMFQVAQVVAKDLDGKVLDDNGQVLEKSSLELITAQLEPIYQMMVERQIPPGSMTAARLFS